METPEEPAASRIPLPAESYATVARGPVGSPPLVVAADGIDPNNPPWSSPTAFAIWIASVLFILFIPALAVLPYALSKASGAANYAEVFREALLDKTALLISIVAVIPTHFLTLAVVWAVVTRFGKRPFWRSLGWSFSERFGFWTSAGLAVALLAVGWAISYWAGGEPTQIDRIAASSTATRYALALLAATTGPLIEELVYRGVLYSAFQRTLGMVWAVVFVSILFTLVHFLQYYNNPGVITVIFILSMSLTLVRAYTGRLLPCFVMHMVFNGIQSLILVLAPYLEKPQTGEQKAAALRHLARALHGFI